MDELKLAASIIRYLNEQYAKTLFSLAFSVFPLFAEAEINLYGNVANILNTNFDIPIVYSNTSFWNK